MSFITRCSFCDTQYRVVADQLRIAKGWVRCGQCQEVFDANENLQEAAPELGDDLFSSEQAVQASSAQAQATVAAAYEDALGTSYERPRYTELDDNEWLNELWQGKVAEHVQRQQQIDGQQAVGAQPITQPIKVPITQVDALASRYTPALPITAPLESVLAAVESERAIDPVLEAADVEGVADVVEAADLAVEPVPLAGTEADVNLEATAQALDCAQPAAEIATALPDAAPRFDEASLSFVKQAQRNAWWRKPLVRVLGGFLASVLLLLLTLQVVVHQRHALAAWQPAWQPTLARMCSVIGCELQALKNIDAMVVTGSSFTQDAQPLHYRLDVSIQNQAATPVAMPALELTLTGPQGQVLARKVLSPAHLGAPDALAARTEWSDSWMLELQTLPSEVSGYQLFIFYP